MRLPEYSVEESSRILRVLTCALHVRDMVVELRSAMVFFQEPVKNLDSGGRTHRPPFHLPVEVESMIQVHVRPAVGVYDRLVQLNMNRAETSDIRVGAAVDLVDSCFP